MLTDDVSWALFKFSGEDRPLVPLVYDVSNSNCTLITVQLQSWGECQPLKSILSYLKSLSCMRQAAYSFVYLFFCLFVCSIYSLTLLGSRPGDCPLPNPIPACESTPGCDSDTVCSLGQRCCLQTNCTKICVKIDIPPPPPPPGKDKKLY